jgi:hypothetical protein
VSVWDCRELWSASDGEGNSIVLFAVKSKLGNLFYNDPYLAFALNFLYLFLMPAMLIPYFINLKY